MSRLRQTWCTLLRGAAVASTLSCALAGSGFAFEPNAELPAGGLVYAGMPSLITEREDIFIASRRVRVTYIIRNSTPALHSGLVAFALPDIDMLSLDGAAVDNPAYDPANAGNYVGVAATVDGQPAEMFLQANALALGLVDVTSALKRHGLPLYPLHSGLPQQLSGLSDEAKRELQNRGAARASDGQLEPIWSLRSTLFWQQDFAASQVRTLALSYQPVAGSAAWTVDTATVLQQRYCIPDADAKALTARSLRGETVGLRWVTYLANAGAIARGPVGQYRITLETAPKEAVYACGEGSASALPRGRESVLTSHVADGEIHVLFVE